MKKAIHIIVIILFLILICTFEQVLTQSFLKETNIKIENLIYISNKGFNENIQEINDLTLNLDDYWTKKENILCTFVSHKEIKEIGVEIDKMKSAIKNNEEKIYKESLNLIHFYLTAYQHIIGINIQSIF